MMRKQLFLSTLIASLLITPSGNNAGMLSNVGSWIEESSTSIYNNALSTKSNRISFATFVALFLTGYIRLHTKRSDKSGKVYDWKELLKVWNSLNREYWNTFDALVIGEAFKTVEVSKTTKEDDGTTTKRKDKEVKCTPKGLLGTVDAYFFMQIQKVLTLIKNVDDLSDRTIKFINVGEFND